MQELFMRVCNELLPFLACCCDGQKASLTPGGSGPVGRIVGEDKPTLKQS